MSIPEESVSLPLPQTRNDGKTFEEVLEGFDKIPFFMTELNEENETLPEVEALREMAYEGTPQEIALNFKAQGNERFAAKQYAEAIQLYTQALDQNSGDVLLDIACLGNRGQCNLELKNYRRCINDCKKVIDLDQKNVKAWYRSAKAFHMLDRNEEAIACANIGLEIDPDNAGILSIKEKAERRLHQLEKMEQERAARQELRASQERTTKLALDSRGISQMYSDHKDHREKPAEDKLVLENPDDSSSTLFLPVMILYPAALQTDFFKSVDENETIGGLLAQLFESPPPWDAKHEYSASGVDVYASTRSGGLAKVGLNLSLRSVVGTAKPDIVIMDDTVRLYVVPKAGANEWLGSWNKDQALQQMFE